MIPPEPRVLDLLKITLDHFFPKFNQWLEETVDPRSGRHSTYDMRLLLWTGLTLFILRIGSRRQFNELRKTESFLKNLLELADSDADAVPHMDSVNHLLKALTPDELQELVVKPLRQLIRNKTLDGFRLEGELLVAVDGTELFEFKEPHCDHCLKRELSNGPQYYHQVLEAKIVTSSGLAFSIATEPVENHEKRGESKQDCERKAFYRLAPKLKAAFPHLRICLLLDGLYACKEVLDICVENRWSFMMVFKQGSIPNLWDQALRKRDAQTENRFEHRPEKGVVQKLSWATNLKHEGRDVHVVFCEETKTNSRGKVESKLHVWLTDLRPNQRNIVKLVNQGGRLRWKIENQGFNEQKNGGFELEHVYGENENAWKNYYFLLQIAHLLSQLMTHGDLFRKLAERDERVVGPEWPRRFYKSVGHFFKSIKMFVRRLTEAFRWERFSEVVRSNLARVVQIRFDTS